MIKCCFLVFLFFSVYGQDLSCLTGSSPVCDFGNGAFTLTIPVGSSISGKTIYAQSLTLVGTSAAVTFLDTTFIISDSLAMSGIRPSFQNVEIDGPTISLTDTSSNSFILMANSNITYSDTLILGYVFVSTTNTIFNGNTTGTLQLSAGDINFM